MSNRAFAAMLVCIGLLAVCAILALPFIHAWERGAGYPFGMMRDLCTVLPCI